MSNNISNIVYNNLDEWTNVRNTMYENIKNQIYKIIIDKNEYNYMIYQGLTEVQRVHLMDFLQQQFEKISNNDVWAEDTAFNIIYGIQGFFQGMIKTQIWATVFKSLDPNQIVSMIFENIKWQLDDDLHIPCLLEDVPKYKCNKCNNIIDYISNNNLCEKCL
jgi:hypothetical protein